jgi:hypothetical protein
MNLKVNFYNNTYKNGSSLIDIKPGAVFGKNYNETLDSGTIIISQLTTPLVLEPFDVAIITGTSFTPKRLVIDTITERIISFDPLTYEYQITLFSETKILENFLLPNLSITQPANPSERKSIGFYINKYLELYGPKKRVRFSTSEPNRWKWEQKFTISSIDLLIFNNTECPEFQWNQPTLREVLTDLMMVLDKIPILNQTVITFLDITKTKNPVLLSSTLGEINFVEKIITSGEAVSELRLNMENALMPKKDNLDIVTRKVEYTSFRNSNAGAFVDTDNMEIVLENPILKLLRVTIMVPIVTTNFWGDFTWIELDITNHCVEKGIYDLLSPEPKELLTYTKNLADINRKQFNVFYSRGGNTISGWGLKYNIGNFLFLTFDEYPFDSILQYVLTEQTLAENFNRMDAVFKVEYETTAPVLMDVGRNYEAKQNERNIFDSQTNAYVDVNAQGKFTQTKINRLGNDTLIITGRYLTSLAVPDIGDVYENEYIVFSQEISVFNDYVNVKLIAAKNYVLRDYFTGVQSRKRNTELATESSFFRHDLKKVYAEFSLFPKFEKAKFLTDAFDVIKPLKLFGFTKNDSVKQPIITAAIKTFDPNTVNVYPSGSTSFYAVELDKKISGNSLLFTLTTKDNVSVGDKITMRTILNINEGNPIRTQERYNYANQSNGEFSKIQFLLIDNYDIGDGMTNWPVSGDYYTNAASNVNTFLTEMRTRPLLNNLNVANNSASKYELPIYKDNKEITKLTMQIEFCADSRSIVFTEQFLKLQKFIREKDFFETRNFVTVAKSMFSFTSNLLGIGPDINYTNAAYMNPENYLGYSVPWSRGFITTPTAEEYVAVLNSANVPTWQSFSPILTLPQTNGGSSYAPIHKVGNKYGTWTGQINPNFANQLMPFWVPFDETGVWTNANDDYIQLVTSTVLSTSGGLTLSDFPAVNFKGGAAVVLNESTNEMWFSLPVATFQASTPYGYTGQSWQWVRKDNIISNLLSTNRIYVSYSNNSLRFTWTGTGFNNYLKNLPLNWSVYVGTTTAHTYKEYDNEPKGSIDTTRDITISTISNNSIRVLFSGSTTGITSYALVDEDGKLILGVNGNNSVYLNVLENRDTRVYFSKTSDQVVGTINNTTNDTYSV